MVGPPFTVGQIVDNRWRVVKNRETAAFTWGYYVRDLNTDELAICTAAISDAQMDVFKRLLKVNAMIVKELGMHGLPVSKFISYGEVNYSEISDGEINYMCTDMIGPSLRWILRNANAASFSLPTALNLGLDMLAAIQEVHKCGYLIRGLHPESFVLPRNSSTGAGLLFATDAFMMARRYLSLDGISSLPLRESSPYRGLGGFQFASIFALRQLDFTRMDDLWQWFYMVVLFVKGDLGWAPLPEGDIYAKIESMANNKEDMHNRPHEWLGSTVPNEFYEILEYLKATPRETPPDYSKLFRLIKDARIRAINQLGGVAPPLDWEPGGQWYDVLAPLMNAE